MTYFPFADYWWFYLGFTLFVLFVLFIDLGVFHKKAHAVSFKEASIWTIVWIGLALIFNFIFYQYSLWKFTTDPYYLSIVGAEGPLYAKNFALEFLTGFVVEKTLAIDNIFVFALVFSYFAIPKEYQHRILFWGILGALVFRAIFVSLGSVLMQYHWVVVFFGVLLMLTGLKMFFAGSQAQNLENNFVVKLLNKIFRVHPKIEGQNFFIKKNGVLFVTPLFLSLVFLELTDIVFAVDSVPAIFSLTNEPLIVFTSNIFAILGLRSMYFMLSGVMERFSYIKYGLAAVLIFVGAKMVYLNQLFNGKFPITWSLLIISALILSSILFSLWKDKKLMKKMECLS